MDGRWQRDATSYFPTDNPPVAPLPPPPISHLECSGADGVANESLIGEAVESSRGPREHTAPVVMSE